MPGQDRPRPCVPDLEQTLAHQIIQRTWGRIHQLHVQVDQDRVLVQGCTSSYYVKQLALLAVLEVLGSDDLVRIELDIQVGASHPRAAQGQNGRWALA